MESAKYHRLEPEELPEPDYFEIELQKIYGPPPTRISRIKKWVRRHSLVAAFVALFLVAAILYLGARTAIKPMLTGILRPDNNQLKQATLVDGTQVQADLSSATSADTDTDTNTDVDGEDITVDVAGSEVANVDGDDIVLSEPGTNKTNVMISPGDLDDSGHSKKPVEIHQDPDDGSNETSAVQPTPTQGHTQPTAAVEQPTSRPSAEPAIQQDNGQVSIQDATPEDKEPLVPIRATFFSGSEGPKSCRGHAIAIIDLPKPQGQGLGLGVQPTAKQCYNFPRQQSSGCALFIANKVDGCEASVFAEPGCRVYMNTVAFMPEERPVGGNWRSVMVQCGVPEPDPATLGQPPMMDKITGMVDNDKNG